MLGLGHYGPQGVVKKCEELTSIYNCIAHCNHTKMIQNGQLHAFSHRQGLSSLTAASGVHVMHYYPQSISMYPSDLPKGFQQPAAALEPHSDSTATATLYRLYNRLHVLRHQAQHPFATAPLWHAA